ncbi:MAG: permease prefix domain 1-containing protein [Blastocatellia bacterium]
MSIIKFILRRCRSKAFECQIEEELRFHIEMRTRDNIAAGMLPEEAERDALQRFGDFDHVSRECREISRERLMNAATMKAMKGITWVMLGCGLTLILISDVSTVRQVGQVLICIAILWWLLLYLRATRPDQQRINQHLEAAEQMPLGLIAPASGGSESGFAEPSGRQTAAHDDQGRSPVERLLAEDER